MTAERSGPDRSAQRWSAIRTQWADAGVAAFPLGGIGTGNVSIGARGEFRDWELSNHPDKGSWLPFTFFAIRVQEEGGRAVSRVLEARIRPPYEGAEGLPMGRLAGLPRMDQSRMLGEYPLLTIHFEDDAVPVDVRLEAFTPLVPLDTNASGLPAAVLRYQVHNPLDRVVDVSIAGTMSGPIGFHGHDAFGRPVFEGEPSVLLRREGALTGVEFGSDLPPSHLDSGTAVLASADIGATTGQWPVDRWHDGAQRFWDAFTADGSVEPRAAAPLADDGLHLSGLQRERVASVGVLHAVQPGETRHFEFVLAWHVPNRARAWNGNVGAPNTHADEVVLNHYATRFDGAWSVASYLARNLEALEGSTRQFHDALFRSTLPPEVVDAVTSTLVVLRSTTCFVLADGSEDGLFAAWEGSFDHAGSCEGTCTHVWNYAQTVAHLFPSLERSARRTEFLHETLDDGRMRFRANSIFGNEPLEFYPAVDGQLGTVVRLYREWRFSGDDGFLRELWPGAKRALDFAFSVWDTDGDLVLDGRQHNTYDIEFYGPNSLGNSMFFAALRAGAAMAERLGDEESRVRYSDAAVKGAGRMDEMLYNGEYYEQRLDDVDEYRYQYGQGCLADQLLGQTLAHLNGLGHILPADHVRNAVAAVFRHNFMTDLREYHSVQRTFALNDDRGLVLCTWPRGGRPRIPFIYSDEVWTGVEYQVATHLIYEGFVDEGLEIVRAVRERHDGIRRSPWNEAECGNHYARSMASWGVLVALTGTHWNGSTGSLRLAPHRAATVAGSFRCFFSSAEGWGEVVADPHGAEIRLLWGTLRLNEAAVDHPELGLFVLDRPTVLAAGQTATLHPPAS